MRTHYDIQLYSTPCEGVVVPMGARPIQKGVDHPEAVEADQEATNGRESLMSKGCVRQLSESAGHNASERRAGLENVRRGSRPNTVRHGICAVIGLCVFGRY